MKVVSLMQGKNLINLVEAVTERGFLRDEGASLMLGKHLINLTEAVTKRGFLRDEGHDIDAEEAYDKPYRGCDRERIYENLQKT
jgi:hypothetical protein